MTSRKTLDLAFCQANYDTAEGISKDLQILGFDVHPIIIDAEEVLNPLSILSVSKNPILLLLSDNLLKSRKCMSGFSKLLSYFNIPSELQPIIIDGTKVNELNSKVNTATRIDRISDVINYMNYWQTKYLQLEEAAENDEPINPEEIEQNKTIANSIGDVLAILRNSPYLRIEEERNIDFDTIKSSYGNPKSLFVKATDKEQLDLDPLRNHESEEPKQIEDKPEAAAPDNSLNPNYDTNLYLQDLEDDDLALLDKIAQQRKNDDLDDHPFGDLIRIDNEIEASKNKKEKNIQQFDLDELMEQEEDIVEIGDQPRLDENKHNNEPEEIDEELVPEEAEKVDSLKNGLTHLELVDQTSTDVEDEFIQPQESYENEADPISVVHQLMTEEKIEECITYLETAIRKYPYNLDLQFSYAKILTKHKGNYLVASDYLENILNTDRKHTASYNLLAEIAENHKDFLLAKSYYEKVISIEPEFANVHYKVGMIIKDHFAEQDQLALKYFKRAFKKDPKNTAAKFEYACLLYKFGDTKKSIKILRNVMKEFPLSSDAPYQLAKIYKEQGEDSKGTDLFEHAKKLNSKLDTDKNKNLFYTPPSLTTEEDDDIFKQYDNNRKRKMAKDNTSSIDKTVLITGATSGIGKATATQFAKEGYRVIITGRRKSRLKETRKYLERNFDASVKHLTFDVQDKQGLRKKLSTLEGAWSQIDILINNAGLALGKDPIHTGQVEHWDTMIDTNIKGLLYMVRAISPYMVKRQKGHIINICSTAGKEVYPNGNVYCATKHAVDALTRSIRLDLYKYNIRVSQVSPAMVEQTEFSKVRFEGDKEKADIYRDFNPLTSEDVADSIYYMATRPAHINIQDIVLMGTQQAGSTYVNRSGRIFDK